MSNPEISTETYERLRAAMRSPAEVPPPRPLAISIWLALSLLQKAIRRRRVELALRAAATLLAEAPDRLWRRLVVIAFEDVGVADVDAIALVLAASASKTARARAGGEWAVCSLVVSRMAKAPKCRAADDLLMIIEHHPNLAGYREQLATEPVPSLLKLATEGNDLPMQALALSRALGMHAEHDPWRSGSNLRNAFDSLAELGSAETVQLAEVGFRRTAEVICAFLPLLQLLKRVEPGQIVDDPLPAESLIGPVPGWALDIFVREGRTAIRRLLASDAPTSLWVRRHVPSRQQFELLGNMVFAVEGGLLHHRWRWPTAVKLRQMAEHESQPIQHPDIAEVIKLAGQDVPALDRMRAHVLL